MKKYALLLILSLGFNYIQSQYYDVTLYKNRDILQFNSAYDQITVLEADNLGNIWFNLDNTWGGAGMGKFTGKEWTIFNMGTDLLNLSFYVNAFAFDLVNNVWVGTDNGLAQFDGISKYGWYIYNMENSQIPDNNITALTVDVKNILWIGCSNGNLAAFDGYKWIIFDNYAKTGEAINDLETDLDGNIWVARNGAPGLLKLRDGSFTEIPGLTDVRNINCDPKGRVLVISKNSLVILENDKIVEVIKPDPMLDCNLYEVEYFGSPFVSSNKGLLRQDGSTFELYSKNNSALPDLVPPKNYNPIPLAYIGENEPGSLWFSFIYGGISANYASIGKMTQTVGTMNQPKPINKDKFNFCFGDSIILDANNDGFKYIWDGGNSTGRTFTVYDTKTVDLAIAATEGEFIMDTLKVNVNDVLVDTLICVQFNQTYKYTSVDVIAQHVFQEEEIGVVTCDPVINKNLVVWKETQDKGTEFYNVYKMISEDDSLYLGSVDFNDLTVFTDNTSNPKDESVMYVITTVDTCGDESFLSSVHKTMLLKASPGSGDMVDLIWGSYEGLPIDYFYIYRGTDSIAMELIDSIAYDSGIIQYTYTDINSPAYKVYYQIGIKLPVPIILDTRKKAGSGPYSQSMSNLEDNRFLVSVNELRFREVLSYPDPFSYLTQIDFENPIRYPYQLIVTDMSGKIVKVIRDIRDNKVIVLRDNLPQGFYLFELKGETVYRGKFVIE